MKAYLVFSFLMAITPSLLLVRYYYKQDIKRPEPKGLVVKIFLLGIIYSLPVYILETAVSYSNVYLQWSPYIYHFFDAFVVAGLCEEYIKLRIIKKYLFNTPRFDEVMDGIVYTIVASLGFACMENIVYVLNSSWKMALARGFTAVPMHAVCSGLMGYYIGKAKFAKTKKEQDYLINTGLWKAVLLHGLYDVLIFISPTIGSAFSSFAVPLLIWTYIRLKEKIHIAIDDDVKSGRV